tara:strand:- start:279 stop:434 length:156 start_codon:yes stop_codon:yes gene_type:complete
MQNDGHTFGYKKNGGVPTPTFNRPLFVSKILKILQKQEFFLERINAEHALL